MSDSNAEIRRIRRRWAAIGVLSDPMPARIIHDVAPEDWPLSASIEEWRKLWFPLTHDDLARNRFEDQLGPQLDQIIVWGCTA